MKKTSWNKKPFEAFEQEAFEMVMPQINRRKAANPRFQECQTYNEMRWNSIQRTCTSQSTAIYSRCAFCSARTDRKTKKKCIQSNKFVCGDHSFVRCPEWKWTTCTCISKYFPIRCFQVNFDSFTASQFCILKAIVGGLLQILPRKANRSVGLHLHFMSFERLIESIF